MQAAQQLRQAMTARILVVEDEAAIREMLRFTLAREGFEVDEAADVAEARRRLGLGAAPLEADGLVLDPLGHRVTCNGTPLQLGPTEYRLLQFFMSHPERVFSRAQLLDRVWGENVFIEERTIDVHIRRLRKALAPTGHDRFVQTVRGAGYRFSTQV